MDEAYDLAARIYVLVPGKQFDIPAALVLAGVAKDVAQTKTCIDSVQRLVDIKTQASGLDLGTTDDAKLKRFEKLYKLIPRDQQPGQAKIMRLVGFADGEITKPAPQKGPTALYMKCKRLMTKVNTREEQSATSGSASRRAGPSYACRSEAPASAPPVARVHVHEAGAENEVEMSLLSPMSDSAASLGSETQASNEELAQISRRTTGGTGATVASLTGSQSTRRSSQDKQMDRRLEQQEDEIRTAAYKVGATLYATVASGRNPLLHFQSAEKCASAVNTMFKVQAISGYQLGQAIKNEQVGQSPPRRGRPSQIPDEDFKDLAQLFYTLAAIEQANSEPNRLNRVGEITLLGSIVNVKRKGDGMTEMNEVALYERIQKANSTMQAVDAVDERDALRVQWLTYNNQLKHHRAWEKMVVEQGFARLPFNEEEKKEKGYVVFYEGQERRFANFDEIKIKLKGNDEQAGGRPPMSHSAKGLPESGFGADTTAIACTLGMGVIGNEPMPPIVIFPTGSKKEQNYKLNPKEVSSFHEIWCQYGYQRKYAFECSFAVSPKGSMTNDIFEEYMNTKVMQAWPDLGDQDGQRAILKADSGPGRHATDFLARSRVEGLSFFPGLPNATENGQEMDQLFSAFKGMLHLG